MQIIILGEECPECNEMEKNVKAALKKLDLKADIEHVYDIREMLETYGMDEAPALVINGTLVHTGDVPDVDSIARMIQDEEWLA